MLFRVPQKFTRRFASLGTGNRWVATDDLSVTHARHLETTLDPYLPARTAPKQLSKGDPLPPAFHLVYFNHAVGEPDLDIDGYDNIQAPRRNAMPLVRRWLKGRIEFNLGSALRLGEDAVCTETWESTSKDPVATKHSVTIHREMRNLRSQSVPSIRESRTLFYFSVNSGLRKRMAQLTMGKRIGEEILALHPVAKHATTASDLLFFRYSALSFNAHRIHYDPTYARSHEGLPGVIMQGPLMVTLLLRWVSEFVVPSNQVRKFEYENLGSVVAGDTIQLHAAQVHTNQWRAWITRSSADSDERLVFLSTIHTS